MLIICTMPYLSKETVNNVINLSPAAILIDALRFKTEKKKITYFLQTEVSLISFSNLL